MSITSLAFILFIFATLIVYFIVPKRFQWVVLLVASCVFYLLSSFAGSLFVLFTAASIYFSTVRIQKITDEQKAYFKANKATLTKEKKASIKNNNKKKKRLIMILTLILNFGIMCVIKYSHFAVGSLNDMFGMTLNNEFSLIVPLGLSFYTFQSTGYLINVYWGNYAAEKNPLKVLLFVSFFPQITQGPISEFDQLSQELFSEHSFTYRNYSRGFQRMLWGFMKKMVIADSLSPWVQNVFNHYPEYTGIATLIGAFLYSIQIYADFSGYMDIMCGYCEMLGIKLTENFERPYFSKSIAEYWRRWHITLGAWFKQYIYYPIGISKWNRKLGTYLTSNVGATIGQNLPATLALVVVWLATGLWHGASWAYVAWGAANGIVIIVSMWLEPVYARIRNKLKVNDSMWLWRAFQVLRTFILITFIKVLPEVGTLSAGLGLWAHIFTEHTIPASLGQLVPFMGSSPLGWRNLLIFAMIILWIITSFLQRKQPIRDYFARIPLVIRVLILLVIFFIIAYIGVMSSLKGGFLYEQF